MSHRLPSMAVLVILLTGLGASSVAPEHTAAAGRASASAVDVPTLVGSPWPQMRRDSSNSASSPIKGVFRGNDRPWSFRTARGIFSTPVIDDEEKVYIGSADGNFYALEPNGKERWRIRTDGIVDAAAALGRRGGESGFPIVFGSGDETLYRLRGSPRRLSQKQRIAWKFRSGLPPATGQLVNWWEGNPAFGPDGLIYVGNTGGGAFAITPGGDQRWVVQRGNSVWTTPAFDAQGNSYWGSVDLFAFSLDPSGGLRWETFTPGYVTSSPALGTDGTVYVGSFDRKLHALDPQTGAERWAFSTAEHIYASPALAADRGQTSAIYIASADGSVYGVAPDGTQLWRYDTGEPVRSSPVLGRDPRGKRRIVYVGSSNGKLYALNAATGERRWSFDTTPENPALADRNDLNGSPALGKRGVYIGGEHGRVWFVPYDYCQHRRGQRDDRCSTDPGQDLRDGVFPVTPGGTTVQTASEHVQPATTLGARLVVRRDGTTLDARIDPGPGGSDSLVSSDPPFDFTTELSGEGDYLFIRPDGLLKARTDYRVRVAGNWTTGSQSGSFSRGLHFRTGGGRGDVAEQLRVGKSSTDALEFRRLALPLPPLLPSVNQIGFDSYDLIAGTLARTKAGAGRGNVLMWVVAAQPGKGGGAKADPQGGFAFPLFGAYRDGAISLNTSLVSLQFSFGPVPLRSLDFRGTLNGDGSFAPGASLYGQVTCADVPNYSFQLRIAGVCNATDTLAAFGTFLGRSYERGGANERPQGVSAGDVALRPPTATEDGEVVARLSLSADARFRASKHLASILLVDSGSGAPIPLDYRTLATQATDAGGNVVEARLRIPAGTTLPAAIRAYTIADVFPLGVADLSP